MTGYVTLNVMLILMFCTSAGFTLIGIAGPICKRLGIIYEDGVIDSGKSDISLRIRPKIHFERYSYTNTYDSSEKTIYH